MRQPVHNTRVICVLTIFFLFVNTLLLAQIPHKMSYQAVIRDADNQLVTNANIGLKISILKGATVGPSLYVETHLPKSNENGLISIEIGGGNVISGSFESIDWAGDSHFIKMEADPAGGNNYNIVSTSQLLSVPYALEAKHFQGYDPNDFVKSSDYIEPQATVTANGHVGSVTVPSGAWTTLLEVSINIEEPMMIMSFGTVSGAGWVDGWRMLQLSIYNHNYTQFYGYANPFGDVAVAHHVLNSGLYHIQLYGLNLTDQSKEMTNISIFALAVSPPTKGSVRAGPFPPPPSAVFPDIDKIIKSPE